MLQRWLKSERSRDVALLWLRVTSALIMIAAHGWPKVLRFERLWDRFPDPLGIGSAASVLCTIGTEVGCALLLIVGLYTRLAALPLAFTMAIAAFVVHGADPWSKKELAVLYMVVFLTLSVTGAGSLSIDGWRAKRRPREDQR